MTTRPPTPRRWLDTVLCAERRPTKTIFDAAVAVVHLADAKVAPEVLVTRRSYITVLLAWLRRMPPIPNYRSSNSASCM